MKTNWTVICATAIFAIAAALLGCGGSGSGGINAPLSGDVAAQAAVVSGYQSFVAGINFPLLQVQETLPSGVSITSLSGHPGRHILSFGAGGLIGGATTTTVGPAATIQLFSDAAKTQSIGNVTVTQTSPTVSTIALGSYTAYPVAFNIAASVTSGSLQMSGSGSIRLTDAKGAGEIKGAFSLPLSKVSVSADLTLDDLGNIGGQASVTENGLTLALSGVTGSVTSTITGNIAIQPQGYTGTASLNILTGAFTVNLKTPTGNATGTTDTNGNLVITLPSGATETITSPLNFNPSTPISNGSGGSGTAALSVGHLYEQPNFDVSFGEIIHENWSVFGRLNSASGLLVRDSNGDLQVLASATSTGTTAVNQGSLTGITTEGFNATTGLVANTATGPYSWSSASAVPIALSNSSATVSGLNNSNQIIGNLTTTGYVNAIYSGVLWSSASAAPTILYPAGGTVSTVGKYTVVSHGMSNVALENVTDADTFSGTFYPPTNPSFTTKVTGTVVNGTAALQVVSYGPGTYTFNLTPSLKGVNLQPITFTIQAGDDWCSTQWINDNGAIVGGTGSVQSALHLSPAYWAPGVTGATALQNPLGRSYTNLVISNGNEIVGSSSATTSATNFGSVASYWSSPTATPVDLPLLPGGYTEAYVSGVNASGTACGFCYNSTGASEAVIWKNGQAIDLKSLITSAGSTFTPQEALGINDANVVFGVGLDSTVSGGSFPVTFAVKIQ